MPVLPLVVGFPLRGLNRRQLLATCQAYRPGDGDDIVAVTQFALRHLAIRILELTIETSEISTRRRRLLAQCAPTLMAIIGVWPGTATALMLAAGDNPDRLGSPAAFAALLGPIPASSGKTTRMRLNRGGDRRGNSALWHIVISRMATQPATKAHVERRTEEGLCKSEIIRCLKRYVAREVFNALPREVLVSQ